MIIYKDTKHGSLRQQNCKAKKWLTAPQVLVQQNGRTILIQSETRNHNLKHRNLTVWLVVQILTNEVVLAKSSMRSSYLHRPWFKWKHKH